MQNSLIGEIADAVIGAKPTDRSSFIKCIQRQLGTSLLKTTDSHNTNSVIFVIVHRGHKVLLKAELGSNTATHKEANWYEHFETLGVGERGFFLGSLHSDTLALLLMRHIEGAITLDEWALEHPTGHDDFGNWVLSMLEYDRSLFAATATVVSKAIIEHFLVSKYHARRKEASAVRYLDNLFANRRITINSHCYLTPDYALEKLLSSEHLRDRLVSDSVGFIHGDLHTGNTLVRNEDLYYVDPNGNFEMPLEYDLAKILHSIHGQYPVIMRGSFYIAELSRGRYDFGVKQEAIYSTAHQKLKDSLDNEQYLRSVFIEAMHFATMLPHHAQNQLETTALFLRSVQLFGELFSLLD